MSIKVLGGLARGLALFVPKGDLIRPTSVRLKRRIFDAHQDWSDKVFVDLCAGSGAMGIEAWSRGAEEVYLSEISKTVYKTLQRNKGLLKEKFSEDSSERKLEIFSKKAELYIEDFFRMYNSWSEEKRSETIIFLDPPYAKTDIYKTCFDKIKDNSNFIGELWIESDYQKGLTREYCKELSPAPYKDYAQGTSYIYLISFGE